MCPSPWHLKHLLMLKQLGLCLFRGGWLFCGVWVLCGVKGGGLVGLGGGLELPLLKGVFRDGGFVKSLLKGCLVFPLLLNLVSKGTYLIKSSKLLQFNHITILRLKPSQVSNYGLFLRFQNSTFDHKFFKTHMYIPQHYGCLL